MLHWEPEQALQEQGSGGRRVLHCVRLCSFRIYPHKNPQELDVAALGF